MSDLNSTAHVELKVNGKEAEETLMRLRKRSKELGDEIVKAAANGDDKGLKRLQKEARNVDRQIKAIESSAQQANNVLARLDKASPRELGKTLFTLNKQLQGIQRGTKAWDDQVAKIKRVKAALKEVNAELSVSEKMTKGGGMFSKFGASVKGAFSSMIGPAALAMGAIAGIGTVIKDGAMKIAEFSQANANLASIMGLSRKEIEVLTEDAKRLGATTQYTATQITGLQTELAKLGFNKQEILDSTEAVSQFATATGSELAEAASLCGSALRAFGLEAKDMDRVASTLAVGTTKSALSFEYLNNGLSTVAPVAKQFGFTIEDTTALLGQLANSGFDASSAATATRNIFLNLADDSGKLAKALGRPIKSLDDLAPAMQELKARGIDLAEMLDITDKRSVAAFATFLDGSDSVLSLRDSVTDCGAALEEMAAKQLDTLEGDVTLLSSAWDGLMLSFGGTEGWLRPAVQWITKVVGQITVMWQNTAAYFQRLYDNSAAFRVIINEVGAAVSNVWDTFKMGIKNAITLLEGFGQMIEGVFTMDWDKLKSGFKKATVDLMENTANTVKNNRQRVKDAWTDAMSYTPEAKSVDIEVNTTTTNTTNTVTNTTGTPTKATGKDDKSKAKDRFAAEDDFRKRSIAQAKIDYTTGQSDYEAYQMDLLQIEIDYNRRKLEKCKEGTTEYLEVQAAMNEAIMKMNGQLTGRTVEEENARYEGIKAILDQRYANGELTNRQYQEAIELAELEHMRNMVSIYEAGSKEQLAAQQAYQKRSRQIQERHIKEQRAIQDKLKAEYFTNKVQTPDYEGHAEATKNLDLVRSQMLAQAKSNQEKLKIEKAYHEARYLLARKYNVKATDAEVNAFRMAIDKSVDWLNSEGGQAMQGAMSVMVSAMGDIFSGLSDIIQAETEIQTAAIERQYDQSISAAEGNKHETSRLEKEKQAEIKKVKDEANKKMFAMQVTQAIAQGAMSAISAYSSAAAIPVVGWIMGPIAAAMAVAATAIQIATIKKQQQASEATGYAEGGFTKKGGKYEPAGIVHAGEWVASQELLANPTASAVIGRLDEAQRTNTIGSLDAGLVSDTITAPVRLASGSSSTTAQPTSTSDAANAPDMSALGRLADRLERPFVTVATVTGDRGINHEQERYNQLMRNKSPKSK